MKEIRNFRQRLLKILILVAAWAIRYAFEFRIDHERFDPVLSRQIDCITYILENGNDEL